MVIFYALIALLAAIAGALIALWIQSQLQKKQMEQRQAWERTQEDQLRNWASQQEKRVTDLGAKLTTQFQQVQQEYQAALRQLKVDHELLRIMRVEETPLTTNSSGQQQPAFSNWRPLALQGADLRGHDLSHRYLGNANLREAQLSGATFFMANLSGASLAKANLAGADLSGVDFSGADLRDAVLSDTNLLVADLHHTNLTGANLLGARGLTAEQIHSALYDGTTLFDADFDPTPTRHDITNAGKSAVAGPTQARIDAVHQAPPSPASTPAPGGAPASKLEIAASEVEETTVNTPTPAPKPEMPAHTVETAPVSSAEPEEFLRGSDLSAEQAPLEPEPEVPTAPGEPMAVAAVAASTTADIPLEVEITPSETPESPDLPVPQAVTDTSPEALQESGTAAAAIIIPEATAPAASPESTEAHETFSAQEEMDMLPLSFLPDMTSFMQHLDESAPVSPLTSGNSSLDPAVADLLADKQEHTHNGAFDTTTPKRKNATKRQRRKTETSPS
jgi:uncharacterized protein YjbI with pentapeptide repeats